ncbi:MAG: carboxymuconolactone decarboxylase family protein [Betaproteobacteria bacterium]
MKLVGNSPVALEGYLSLNGALAKGTLNVKVRESIALAVAEYNGCEYCLSAHDYLARNVAKLNDGEIDSARAGNACRQPDQRGASLCTSRCGVPRPCFRHRYRHPAHCRLRGSRRDRNRRQRRASGSSNIWPAWG